MKRSEEEVSEFLIRLGHIPLDTFLLTYYQATINQRVDLPILTLTLIVNYILVDCPDLKDQLYFTDSSLKKTQAVKRHYR